MAGTQADSYALDSTWRTLLTDLGVAPANVLRRAGFADDLLARPSVRLAPADYYRLWACIETEIGDSLLPIRLCEAVRGESFSPPLFAALCSPNLVVAIQRIAKFKRLVAPIRLTVVERGDKLVVEFNWLDAPLVPPTTLVAMELLFSVTLARIGTRQDVSPVEVMTTALPSPRTAYENFLHCRLTLGNAHRVTFSAADATRPFLTSNDGLWSVFEPELHRRLADLQGPVTTARRIRAALLEGLPSGLCSMEAIATKLSLSTRTLQRRVAAEGTSFQNILNETRLALAHHYLEQSRLPSAEIAFLLGFDEPNSFYRAFKSWTGRTPDSVRQS